MRYKSRPITPVDAVQWNGTNIEEVQEICPSIVYNPPSEILVIPDETGGIEVVVGDMVLREVGTQRNSKLGSDVFAGLYQKQ